MCVRRYKKSELVFYVVHSLLTIEARKARAEESFFPFPKRDSGFFLLRQSHLLHIVYYTSSDLTLKNGLMGHKPPWFDTYTHRTLLFLHRLLECTTVAQCSKIRKKCNLGTSHVLIDFI